MGRFPADGVDILRGMTERQEEINNRGGLGGGGGDSGGDVSCLGKLGLLLVLGILLFILWSCEGGSNRAGSSALPTSTRGGTQISNRQLL
jgi:hypothetical protein